MGAGPVQVFDLAMIIKREEYPRVSRLNVPARCRRVVPRVCYSPAPETDRARTVLAIASFSEAADRRCVVSPGGGDQAPRYYPLSLH